MIRSMTGYGRAESSAGGRDIIVEIKSVNHRYFEFSSRVSRGYGFLEEKLKSYLQSRVFRGKVDVYLSIMTMEDVDAEVRVNHSLAGGYVAALRELGERYSLRDDISVSTVARYSDIFSVHRAAEDEDEVWEAVRPVVDEALSHFISMRETEGARLKADVEGRAGTILSLVQEIERRSPETLADYQKRLRARIEELLGDAKVDEQRLLTETAIFADKIAVAEETVRLRSHFDQMFSMLGSGQPVGRKLDFIVQEMNREANTIGSKAQDAEIAHMVVDIKAEIEKIREQIQNIE